LAFQVAVTRDAVNIVMPDNTEKEKRAEYDRLKRLIRVLVLEEHPAVRAGIARAIESTEDIIVVDDTDSSSGLRTTMGSAATHDRVPADVIIMDVNTRSDTSAMEKSDSRLVGFSEISEAALIKSILARGVNGFVHRSESPELLIKAIRAVIADEQFLSPETKRILSNELDSSTVSDSESLREKQSRAMQTIELLTPREIQVLQLITDGNSTNSAALALGLSVKTIETHRKNIGDKIGTRNLAVLTKIAILTGLTEL